ncbi:MAG: thiamine phosphate synthase [Pseudomonadota bacterium]
MKRHVIEGLYAITPDELDTARLLDQVEQAVRGGIRILQYRNKLASSELAQHQAMALRTLTRAHGVTYIVNDDVHLAQQVDADGVHLGGEDGSIAAARALLGSARLIGASCYNRAPLAEAAVAQGVDYIAFGAFFPSSVKPAAVKADVALLQQAWRVPVVAIGGITQANGKSLVVAGADALAVISALWQAPDIERAARDFSYLFEQGDPA